MTREEAIELLENLKVCNCAHYLFNIEKEAVDMGIEALKERPHGEWKYNPDCVNDEMQAEFYCSICNQGAYSRHDNFCPFCGADMRPKEGGEK